MDGLDSLVIHVRHLCKYRCAISIAIFNQRTNGPVNAHLISGPRISTKYTKPGKKQGQEMNLTFNTHLLSFTELVVCIYKFSGHLLQWFLRYPLFSHFPIAKPKLPNLTLP